MPTNPAPSASFQAKLLPNRAPRKGVAIPKYDVKSIWEAIGFTPHAGQWEVYQGWLTHSVTTNVAGTRWGKSEFGAHLPLGYIAPCWKEVVQDGRLVKVDHYTTGAIVAPTYDLTGIIMGKLYSAVLKLCKALGYQPKAPGRTKHFTIEEDADGNLLDIDPEPGVLSVRKTNGVIRTIITPWGNRFDAFTMADPRGLLGKAFDWILTDESGQFDDMDWRNWFEYADRALIDREGWVYHGTTPKGFNALYFDFFIKGRPGPQRDLEYISFQQPTTRNTHLNADWIERKRKNTPPRLWAMNYLAQFSILDGQVYEEFSRDTHVRAFTPREEWRYFLGMDFGFTDPFVCQLIAWTGEEFALIDEVYQAGITTRQQKALVHAMLAAHLPHGAQWLAPGKGQWLVWGDPRGGQARAEWAALGVPIRKPNMHLRSGQKGSIEATAQIVAEYLHPIEDRPYPAWAKRPGDDLGAPRLIIHERCAQSIHSLQSWVKKGDGYDGDDHPADSLRYGLMGARPYAVPLALLDERASRHQNQPGQRQRGPRKLPVRRLRDAKGNALSLGRR